MTYWITRRIATKAVSEDLAEDEYGLTIVDVRHLKDGGGNEIVMLVNAVKKLMALCSMGPVIIQCQAGISRSNALAATLLVMQVDMEWDDALDFVKKKVPRAQFNQDLVADLKKVFTIYDKSHHI